MKLRIFLLMSIFGIISHANTLNETNTKSLEYSYYDAITFKEGGIDFKIYLNGKFDFRRNFYKSVRTDHRGRIKRIGNVFISYDYRGNLHRIGSVYMSYFNGKLCKVGDMRINYDCCNRPIYKGKVKPGFCYNTYYNNREYYPNYYDYDYDYHDNFFRSIDFRSFYRKYKEDLL